MGKSKRLAKRMEEKPNEWQKEYKSSQKQKIIAKLPKQKQVKIQKIKVKKGRPFNVNERLRYNETDNIKNSIIKYLMEIGFKQGLVFTQKERASLQEQQNNNNQLPKIEWDNQHRWKKQQQIQKIKNILQMDEHSPQQSQIIQFFLDIADIFPREITAQIYRFLWQMYKIAKRWIQQQKKQQLQRQLSAYVYNIMDTQNSSLIFLTNKFSKMHGSNKERLVIYSKLEMLCEAVIKQMKKFMPKLEL